MVSRYVGAPRVYRVFPGSRLLLLEFNDIRPEFMEVGSWHAAHDVMGEKS